MPEMLPYQNKGAEWLASKKYGLLADEQRLGKCCQTVRALDILDPLGVFTVLITCPATAREGWKREFMLWGYAPRKIVVLFSAVESPVEGAVNICSYEYCASAERRPDKSAVPNPKLMAMGFDAAAFDEGHYLKSVKAARTQVMYGWKNNSGIVHRCKRLWILTGTPAPNNPSELYPHCKVLFSQGFKTADGKPMNRTQFIDRYCAQKEGVFGKTITGGKNLAELKERLQPYMLRRRQAEVWEERKAPVVANLYLDAQQALKALRTAEEYDLMLEMGKRLANARDDEIRQRILNTIDEKVKMRLRRLLGLAKVKPLSDKLRDELENGMEKVVVFAHHRDVLHGLRKNLSSLSEIAYIDGSTDPRQRDPEVQKFKNPDCRIFIGQLQAAGTAIDLSSANDLVFAEYGWVPGDNDQPEMRIQNLKKREATLIRYAVVSGTLDEQIANVVRQKRNVLEELFDA